MKKPNKEKIILNKSANQKIKKKSVKIPNSKKFYNLKFLNFLIMSDPQEKTPTGPPTLTPFQQDEMTIKQTEEIEREVNKIK